MAAGRQRPFEGTSEHAVDALSGLLLPAVGRQMVADVPLGAFLSGGIDSSTIVALMQAQSARPVRTFSIGFEEPGYDEAAHARAVAGHLGTDHTELYLSARDALDVIPRLPDLFDEPFADPAQIPNFLIAAMARRDVTVALSGDGGDELFGGYDHYASTPRIWRWLSHAPMPVRRFGAGAVSVCLPAALAVWPARFLRRLPGRRWTPDKAYKLAWLASCRTQEELHWRRVSLWPSPDAILCGATEPETILNEPANWPDASEFEERLMAVDRPKAGFNVPISSWLRGSLKDWAEALLDERRLRDDNFFHPHSVRRTWREHLKHESWGIRLWNVLMFQAWLDQRRRERGLLPWTG